MRNGMNAKLMLVPLFIAGAVILTGLVVMLLWNGIMPEVFGLGIVTLWQAIGLLILGRFLFGRFGKGRHSKMRQQYAHCSSSDKSS